MTPRQQEIWNAYRQTGSAPRAAKKLKITPQAVLQAIKRAQKTADHDPLSYDAFVDEHMPQIVAARAQRKSATEIAKDLGMNPVTLRSHCKPRGVTFGSRYSDKERALWERMYFEKQMSSYDIHRATGVPRSTIDKHLRSCGQLRDKTTATRLALSTDPSKRRGGHVQRTKKKQKKQKKKKVTKRKR